MRIKEKEMEACERQYQEEGAALSSFSKLLKHIYTYICVYHQHVASFRLNANPSIETHV